MKNRPSKTSLALGVVVVILAAAVAYIALRTSSHSQKVVAVELSRDALANTATLIGKASGRAHSVSRFPSTADRDDAAAPTSAAASTDLDGLLSELDALPRDPATDDQFLHMTNLAFALKPFANEDLDAMVAFLEDGDQSSTAKIVLVLALVLNGHPDVIETLLPVIHAQPVAIVRERMAATLTEVAHPEGIDILVSTLAVTGDPVLLDPIAEAAAAHADEETIALLEELYLEPPAFDVQRGNVVAVIESIRSLEAVTALETMAGHRDPYLAEAARTALDRIHGDPGT